MLCAGGEDKDACQVSQGFIGGWRHGAVGLVLFGWFNCLLN